MINDAENLMQDLEQELQLVMIGPVLERTKELIQQEVNALVYDGYTPVSYRRRYSNGGIGDKDQYLEFIDFLSFEVTDDREEMDNVIAGQNYIWAGGQKPDPRPVFVTADADVQSDSLIEAALQQACNRIPW